MLAEIIAIGDELTSGQRLDTNSQWISQQLGDIGIQVVQHQTISDYLHPMLAAFQQAAQRCDVILVTGGLGPTADDLTRQAIADAFGLPLQFDDSAWDHIQKLFKSRNYPIPENNRIQAMFPQSSVSIPNPSGTAPGIDLQIDPIDFFAGQIAANTDSQPATHTGEFQVLKKVKTTSRFFCLPGVPAEMKEMFHLTVLPRIQQWMGGQTTYIRRHVIKTFGAGESHVESELPDLIKRGNDPQVGITASKATISLRIEAKAASIEQCEAKIAPVVKIAKQTLGDLVYGEGEQELEDVVVPMLQKTDHRLVIVEWGTAGWVSQSINRVLSQGQTETVQDKSTTTAATATSDFQYNGSVILNARDSVLKWLAPDATPASISSSSDVDPYSPAAIRELLKQVCRVAASRFQANLAIATGPMPNTLPSAADSASEINSFQIVAYHHESFDKDTKSPTFYSKQFNVVGHSSIWLPRASKQTLNHLRLFLMSRLSADQDSIKTNSAASPSDKAESSSH